MKIKKIGKLAIAIIAVLLVTFSRPASAQSGDWRSNFRSIFEDTTLQKVDEKIRTKAEEIKKSDILRKETRQDTKEKVKETWSKAKNWLGDKWDSYGKHTYAADGFKFLDNNGNRINKVYLTVKIGTFRNTMYFSDANGAKINQYFSWTDITEIKKYRFITPVANGKIFTNFAVSYGEKNIFPSGKYDVWAECEDISGSKFYRPAPVSKEKFKTLKSGERGIEFTPDFN